MKLKDVVGYASGLGLVCLGVWMGGFYGGLVAGSCFHPYHWPLEEGGWRQEHAVAARSQRRENRADQTKIMVQRQP